VNRKSFLTLIGATLAPAACGRNGTDYSSSNQPALVGQRNPANKPDFALAIGKLDLEVARGRVVRTIAYNGQVPGPLLKMPGGRPITVDVKNDTDHDELVHWHGQIVPDTVDGVAELGTPVIPAHGSRRYTFVPQPRGTRWYHSHVSGGARAAQGTFTGQFGFVYVEPRNDPGRYDREIFLALHEWEPKLVRISQHVANDAPSLTRPAMSMDAMQGMMGRGTGGMMGMGSGLLMMSAMSMLEVQYALFSVNGKALGFGEPMQVRQGERILVHLLNASATLTHRIALAGHTFEVIALDGNPIATPRRVNAIELGVAERVDAIVDTNNPGVWVLGSTQDEYRRRGLGIVVEYAGRHGTPQWSQSAQSKWDYVAFGSGRPTAPPEHEFVLELRQLAMKPDRWGINGKSYPNGMDLIVDQGCRYRLSFQNMSMMEHPMHLHGHVFELVSVDGRSMAGVNKDTVVVRPMMGRVSVDFVADNPGRFLLHCHNELHMDGGLGTVLRYANS
jgi:FtsP/CotA-like multicopper oxidase with cupredoxin domain